MPISKSEVTMSRVSIYISEPNRRRLPKVPRGLKTKLVNKALDNASVAMERRENFDSFMVELKKIERFPVTKGSIETLTELRESDAK